MFQVEVRVYEDIDSFSRREHSDSFEAYMVPNVGDIMIHNKKYRLVEDVIWYRNETAHIILGDDRGWRFGEE